MVFRIDFDIFNSLWQFNLWASIIMAHSYIQCHTSVDVRLWVTWFNIFFVYKQATAAQTGCCSEIYGAISMQLIAATIATSSSWSAHQRSPRIFTSPFTIDFGMRQGPVLPQHLFAVLSDDMVAYLTFRNETLIARYADDILLLAPSVSELQRLLSVWEWAQMAGFEHEYLKKMSYEYINWPSLTFRRQRGDIWVRILLLIFGPPAQPVGIKY